MGITRVSALLLIGCVLPCSGQNTFGDITGVVNDSSGAVIAGAAVTVTNPQTNFIRTTRTNSSGNYDFPALLPGNYNVKAELAGFETELRSGIELQVQQNARIDFKLNVGAQTQTVEVTGGAPLLNTESATVGTVVENQRIVELPLNGRDFLQLVALSPNVSANFSVNGGAANGAATSRLGGQRANESFAVSGSGVSITTTLWTVFPTRKSITTPTSSCHRSMRSRNSRFRPGSIQPSLAAASVR
jgi:hypothetical protein